MTAIDRAPEHRTALVAAAGVIAVVTTLVILVWGFVPLPDFPSLTDEPDASVAGEIAYLAEHDRDGRSCLMVAAASGQTTRELSCFDGRSGDWVDRIGWTGDGDIVVVRYGPTGPTYEILDAVTGGSLATGPFPEDYPIDELEYSPDLARDGIRVENIDRRVRVTVDVDGTQRVVLDVEAPQRYAIWQLGWSPDRQHLLAVDSESRVLILEVREGGTTRVLVDDARSPTWYIDGFGADRPVEVGPKT